MADLSELTGSGSTKLVGSDAAGIEGAFIGQTDQQLWTRPVPDFTFSVRVDAQTLALNKSLISLWNGSGGRIVRLQAIYIVNNQTTAVTGVAIDVRLHRFTSAPTGGTTLTPFLFDTQNAVPGGITARAGATIAGEDANYFKRWLMSTDEWGPGTLDVEGSDHPIHQTFPLYQHLNGEKQLTIRANEGFHIKQITNTTAGSLDLMFIFSVDP